MKEVVANLIVESIAALFCGILVWLALLCFKVPHGLSFAQISLGIACVLLALSLAKEIVLD